MSKSKIVLVAFFVGLISAFLILNYIYKDHRDISAEEAAFTIDAADMIEEFTTDAERSSSTYLDKTVLIKGIVSDIQEEAFVLASVIYCYADSLTLSALQIADQVEAKGRFIGFDELLETIKIDQVTTNK